MRSELEPTSHDAAPVTKEPVEDVGWRVTVYKKNLERQPVEPTVVGVVVFVPGDDVDHQHALETALEMAPESWDKLGPCTLHCDVTGCPEDE